MKSFFFLIAYISIFSILLLVFVGSSVRMLGAGMGCPDWPKCYGYVIPPTNDSQIQWKPFFQFKKGQMVLKDKKLFVAKKDLFTKSDFNASNWNVYYENHVFSPWNTWVEFINRMFGAITGLVILILFVTSIFMIRSSKLLFVLSLLMLCFVIFQAWLGALVVYSNLQPIKVTIHMLVALLMVLLNVIIIKMNKNIKLNFIKNKNDKRFVICNYILFFLILTQIFFGSQVRHHVDKSISYLADIAYINKNIWLNGSNYFYVHRSFSILIILFLLIMWALNHYKRVGYGKYLKHLSFLLLANVIIGIVITYFHFPILSQPAHLTLAFILLAYVFGFLILVRSINKDKT